MKKIKYQKPFLIKAKVKLNFFQFRMNGRLLAVECLSSVNCNCCARTSPCSC
jgi:hypothetical protein